MSNRRNKKNRARLHRQTPSERKGQGASGAVWLTNPPPPHSGDDLSHVSICAPVEETSDTPGNAGNFEVETGYDASLRNAITHGMRCQKVFPKPLGT